MEKIKEREKNNERILGKALMGEKMDGWVFVFVYTHAFNIIYNLCDALKSFETENGKKIDMNKSARRTSLNFQLIILKTQQETKLVWVSICVKWRTTLLYNGTVIENDDNTIERWLVIRRLIKIFYNTLWNTHSIIHQNADVES